jgi:TRAP-type C4-dicarboxylate transport system substrate-binding protein
MVTSQSCRWVRIARGAALATIAVVAAALHVGDSRAEPTSELKLSVAVGPAYALGMAGDRWAKRIAERSEGRLQVKVFAGATLAQRDPAREFTALKNGAADLAVGSSLYWSAQVKELGVVGLPWLVAGRHRLDALLSAPVADAFSAAVTREGVVPVAFAALGFRVLATTDRAVEIPADLGGMRVRIVAPPAVAAFYAALGAQPGTMTFAAAEAAFAAGTLDAQDGSVASFAATHVYSIGLKRVLLWDAIAEAAVFAVNRSRWESWTEAERSVVLDSARDVAGELAGLAQREEDAALKDLRRGGMTIVRLTPSGRDAFIAATRGLYNHGAAIAGPDLVREAEAAVAAVTP